MGLEYLLFRRGPLTMAPSQLGGFAKSDASARDAQPRISRPAVEPRPLRRAAASLPGLHRVGLQSAAREPRLRAHQVGRRQRPIRRSGPTISRCRPTARWRSTAMRLTRRICAAPALARFEPEEFRPGASTRATRSSRARRATSARPSSTPSAPARWGATRWPWSTSACACTGSRACAWSTPRSCRPSPRATPTRPTIMIAEKAADMIREDAART